jgi:hypothetical protein
MNSMKEIANKIVQHDPTFLRNCLNTILRGVKA